MQRMSKRRQRLAALLFCALSLGSAYAAGTLAPEYCKSCGSETTCLEGSNVQMGWEECELDRLPDGTVVGCSVGGGYGACSA